LGSFVVIFFLALRWRLLAFVSGTVRITDYSTTPQKRIYSTIFLALKNDPSRSSSLFLSPTTTLAVSSSDDDADADAELRQQQQQQQHYYFRCSGR
jgi:hypothetical protein